jgi:hypothetical protein
VLKALREFVGRWQERYREGPDRMGAGISNRLPPGDWPQPQSRAGGRRFAAAWMKSDTNAKASVRRWKRRCVTLENHVIGSGSLSKVPALLENILRRWPRRTAR